MAGWLGLPVPEAWLAAGWWAPKGEPKGEPKGQSAIRPSPALRVRASFPPQTPPRLKYGPGWPWLALAGLGWPWGPKGGPKGEPKGESKGQNAIRP